MSDWDIFTIGYATTLLPDVVGVWSADPDLPIISTVLTVPGQVAKPRGLMLPGIELMTIVSTEQTVLALSTTVPS